jgi:c(7)-type cytochrome triheme protein
MKGVAEPKAQTLSDARFREAKRVVWLLASILLGLLCLLVMIEVDPVVSAVTNASASVPAKAAIPVSDYSKFSHSSPKEHADLMGRGNCASCHRRSDGPLEPKFPLHKDCTGCHLVQFTASNNSSSVNPICTICHKAEGLNSSNAPLKSFPRLMSFAAEFDHAQHLKGIESALPGKGCAACHSPANRGVGETIPARLNAHQVCYDCHSPGKSASKTSSCGSCHRLGSYSPTSSAARAYRMGFSHADHGPRERLNCDRCHDVRGRGLPQARQVSSIAPVQHLTNSRAQNCIACHNGQRAFGESANFTECSRCHKRTGFRIGE